MSKLFDLQNKNVLLTGASKGMGLAMAQGLVSHGQIAFTLIFDGPNSEA